MVSCGSLLLACAACCCRVATCLLDDEQSRRPSTGCVGNGTGAPPSSGWHSVSVDDPIVGTLERWFIVHVPPGYDASVPTPLVLDLHGCECCQLCFSLPPARVETGNSHLRKRADSQDAKKQLGRTRVDQVADRENFIVAYPDGWDDAFNSNGKEAGWNAVGTVGSPGLQGPTCTHPPPNGSLYSCYESCKFGPGHHPPGAGRGCFMLDEPPHRKLAKGCDCSSCVDDGAFITALVQQLMSTMCIERRRVHATGFSNGGMMVYELAFNSGLAPVLASIAPVAGAPMIGQLAATAH